MKLEKIHLIGLADGLKPRIILEVLSKMPIWKDKCYTYITDSEEGIAVEFCKKEGLPIIVINKEDMLTSISKIQDLNPNLLLCIGWNKKIPEQFLNIFDNCINCHSGLLPDYRGDKAYMHNYANISDEYGITIHFMNGELDDGRILLKGSLKLYLNETPEIMHRRISEITGMLIPEAIRLIENEHKGTKQEGKARYFFKITREEMELIRKTNIENMRRGLPKKISPHKEWEL